MNEHATIETEVVTLEEVPINWAKVAEHAGWLKSVDDLPPNFSAKGRRIVAHTGSLPDLNALLQTRYKSWNSVSLALTSIFKSDGRFSPEQIAAALLCDLACNRQITDQNEVNQRNTIARFLYIAHTPPPQLKWREVRANGSPVASFYNVRIGIEAMGIECRHDLFRDVTNIGFKGDKVVHEVKPLIGELNNATLLRLRHLFSERYSFDPEDKNIFDAVKSLAFENCFDPILDMLAEAEGQWDGVKRLDTWAVDYLGCDATELNCTIGRKVLIAAVRRARVPGDKFDTIVVLESPEGQNKSTAIRVLAGDDYFSDQSILGVSDREAQELMSGVWMYEIADLSGIKKADANKLKAFASRQVDRARPAYGRVKENMKRRSILWGTTNDSEYLQSDTGNRRWWPLATGLIDIEALRRDRLQLLGEAAKYESDGESLILDQALWGAAAAAQEVRRIKHPWEDILADIPREK